jgi:hypothetical protein
MSQPYSDRQPLDITNGIDHRNHQENANMNDSRTLTLFLLMTAFATAGGGIAHAGSHEYESGAHYELDDDAAIGFGRDQQRVDLSQTESMRAQASNSHWRVTDALYDHTGRLSMLQHTVPLHDMAIFGRITSGIVENGLKLDRVDAVFNEADSATPVPHYHFTQRFL